MLLTRVRLPACACAGQRPAECGHVPVSLCVTRTCVANPVRRRRTCHARANCRRALRCGAHAARNCALGGDHNVRRRGAGRKVGSKSSYTASRKQTPAEKKAQNDKVQATKKRNRKIKEDAKKAQEAAKRQKNRHDLLSRLGVVNPTNADAASNQASPSNSNLNSNVTPADTANNVAGAANNDNNSAAPRQSNTANNDENEAADNPPQTALFLTRRRLSNGLSSSMVCT